MRLSHLVYVFALLGACSDDANDTDCPEGSACVVDDVNSMNYCFLICVEKADCNANRPVESEASCTSSLTFVDGDMGRKACRPSHGT